MKRTSARKLRDPTGVLLALAAFGQLWSPLVNVHPQTLHDDKFPHLINGLAGA